MCSDKEVINYTECGNVNHIHPSIKRMLESTNPVSKSTIMSNPVKGSWFHDVLLQDAKKIKEKRLRKFYELEKKFT